VPIVKGFLSLQIIFVILSYFLHITSAIYTIKTRDRLDVKKRHVTGFMQFAKSLEGKPFNQTKRENGIDRR